MTGLKTTTKKNDKKSILVLSLDLFPDLLYRVTWQTPTLAQLEGVNSGKRGQDRHFKLYFKLYISNKIYSQNDSISFAFWEQVLPYCWVCALCLQVHYVPYYCIKMNFIAPISFLSRPSFMNRSFISSFKLLINIWRNTGQRDDISNTLIIYWVALVFFFLFFNEYV